MKVLQVLPTLSAGGAEGFITNLSVSLAGMGSEVQVFLLAGVRGDRGHVLAERLKRAGIKVTGAEARNIRSPLNLVRLVWLVWKWRPDVVQANLESCEIACALARFLVFGSHTLFACRLANTLQVTHRPNWLLQAVSRMFGLTIACSLAVAEAQKSLGAVGKTAAKPLRHVGRKVAGEVGEKQASPAPGPRKRLVTIRNGIHVHGQPPTSREWAMARRSLGVSEHDYVVGHIGRMSAGLQRDRELASSQKAHDVLISAFAKAFRGDAQCVLLLLGDGPLRTAAEALAHQLGVAGQTRFLGEQPEPWPVLFASDVFFFPSRYEGMPNALIEAASCGLPIVASDIPEIRSLRKEDSWQLRPVDDVGAFADALVAVRQDRESFALKAATQAVRISKEFSMRACAEHYLTAYRFRRQVEFDSSGYCGSETEGP